MWTYLSTFLLSLLVALMATPIVRQLAIKWGVLDKPGERRIHTEPIPRMGGVAIFAALLFTTAGVFAYSHFRETVLLKEPSVFVDAFAYNFRTAIGISLGATIILALGIYDDVKGTSPLLKLAVQIGVALMCYQLGFRVEIIGIPFSEEPFTLGILSLPFTVLWMVLIINAINLIDGIDGLASGASFFACVTMFVLAYKVHDLVSAFTMVALGGAILGFLVFNSNPAMVFLGDSGSLLLGFVLAAVSIRGSTKGAAAFSILVSAMALGLPLLDTSLAVVRRALTGKPLMGADKEHIHHRLLKRGLTQRQVVMALYGLSAFLAFVALATSFLQSNRVFLTIMFVALAGILLVSMRYLGYIQHIRQARRTLFLHDLFGGVSTRTDCLIAFREALADAGSLEEVSSALVALQAPFQLSTLQLELEPHSRLGNEASFELKNEVDAPLSNRENAARLELPLGRGVASIGRLTIFWWQDGGDTHPELYRMYFEWVKTELERTLENPRPRLPDPSAQT